MAIKISGNTVIDDGKNICNIANVTACGTISLNGVVYPTADGSNGQFLKTNGSGTLSFANGSNQIVVCEMTSSGTFTMPATACYIQVEVWGGGGGGGSGFSSPIDGVCFYAGQGGGGTGGGYMTANYLACCITPTVCVIVGAGGSGGGTSPTAPANGAVGGTSCFGSYICVSSTVSVASGSKSGHYAPPGIQLGIGFGAGTIDRASSPSTNTSSGGSGFGGGGGGARSIFAPPSSTTQRNGSNGGFSIFGGGGGGSGSSNTTPLIGGSSVYGTAGANGGASAVGYNASGFRGGGGGGGAATGGYSGSATSPPITTYNGGCGSPGSVRITIW